ncbi:hypothetical protein BSKO_10175 [Bryopsis sp. KO-2023]|nr:hypothetical protein BSKO_10175 [Bryopsis sp. KO-2023]
MNAGDGDHLRKWKSIIPLLYDWLANHNLTWPSLTCRWGPQLGSTAYRKKYRLYFSEQTDGSDPQRITVATADVFRPRVASADKITGWSDMEKCPYVKVEKSIVHPGEVNKLRDCPLYPKIIVTHTDAPELYVWNVETQPHRSEKGRCDASTAELVLTGHEGNAEYALGMCHVEPKVASGGKDRKVLVWDLQDHVSTLATTSGQSGSPHAMNTESTRLEAQLRLSGHEDTVEDVVFQPGSSHNLASVGDDYQLLLWDARAGDAPVSKVQEAHGKYDLHCVDWSPTEEDLLATGCADGVLKIWDRRKLSATEAVETIGFHRKAVMRVEWSPHNKGILTSGGEDNVVCVWNLKQKGSAGMDSQDIKRIKRSIPQQLLFQHIGHKSVVVDFHMNPHDPWTMLSVSDDVSADSGGGTLQMWRISDMITRPEADVLSEIAEIAERGEKKEAKVEGAEVEGKEGGQPQQNAGIEDAVDTVLNGDAMLDVVREEVEVKGETREVEAVGVPLADEIEDVPPEAKVEEETVAEKCDLVDPPKMETADQGGSEAMDVDGSSITVQAGTVAVGESSPVAGIPNTENES